MTSDLSPSALALAEVLATDTKEARDIRARVHRTALWKYTTGRRNPDLETATILESLSEGRVLATGWIVATDAVEKAG